MDISLLMPKLTLILFAVFFIVVSIYALERSKRNNGTKSRVRKAKKDVTKQPSTKKPSFINPFFITDLFNYLKFNSLKRSDEDRLVSQINRVLAKEQSLRSQEKVLQKEIEQLYQNALSLRQTPVLNEHSKKLKALKNKGSLPQSDASLSADVKEVLKITDALLEKLPEEEIRQFAGSKEFEKYKSVMSKIR